MLSKTTSAKLSANMEIEDNSLIGEFEEIEIVGVIDSSPEFIL